MSTHFSAGSVGCARSGRKSRQFCSVLPCPSPRPPPHMTFPARSLERLHGGPSSPTPNYTVARCVAPRGPAERAPGWLASRGAVAPLFTSRSSIGARLVAGLFSRPETLLASARALRYARVGDALAWVEPPLVAVAVKSVPALRIPNGHAGSDAAGNASRSRRVRPCNTALLGRTAEAVAWLYVSTTLIGDPEFAGHLRRSVRAEPTVRASRRAQLEHCFDEDYRKRWRRPTLTSV